MRRNQKPIRKSKDEINVNHEDLDNRLENWRKSYSENEKKISALVSKLSSSEGSAAYDYIVKEINELHEKNEQIQNSIKELETIKNKHVYSEEEFNALREMLVNYGNSFESMTVEQKRAALRVFIERVVWDGENVHIFLCGSGVGSVNYNDGNGNNVLNPSDTNGLDEFSDAENSEPKRGGCK